MKTLSKIFLILGGYGNTGRLITELLLRETDVQIILSGRNIERAKALAQSFNETFETNRVSAMQVDAANPNSLHDAFAQIDFVVVASSTIDYVQQVAKATIAAKIDYLDTQLSTESKIQMLRSLKAEMEQAGCCFITDSGFHPGVPAALVRYAANSFDQIEKANVASLIKVDWASYSFAESTMMEMIEEFKYYRPLAYQNGEWKKYRWKDYKTFDFGNDFGRKKCVPMMMEELRELPVIIPSLQETGFFVAGFHWFTDYFIMPLMMIALKIAPQKALKPSAKIFTWSLQKFIKPPFKTILLLEASGIKEKQSITMHLSISHEDGYFLTAVPVVACLLQYLNKGIRKPGLNFQANIVEPKQFFDDIQRMGIKMKIGQIGQ